MERLHDGRRRVPLALELAGGRGVGRVPAEEVPLTVLVDVPAVAFIPEPRRRDTRHWRNPPATAMWMHHGSLRVARHPRPFAAGGGATILYRDSVPKRPTVFRVAVSPLVSSEGDGTRTRNHRIDRQFTHPAEKHRNPGSGRILRLLFM